MTNKKRPREYASEIMQLKTKEDRIKALDAVPEHFKLWVKGYVKTSFEMRKMERNTRFKGY